MSEIPPKVVTIEEVMDQVDKLMEVDVGNLGTEALRNAKIFTALQRLYVAATNKLEKLMIQHDAIKLKRYRYYTGKLTAEEYSKEPLRESLLKGDVESYLKIDIKVVEARMNMTQQETIVKYLEECKWRLKARGEEIRMAIDFQRQQLGI